MPVPDGGTSKEKCGNGMDDNFNSQIDEGCYCGSGQKQACYRGPRPPRGIGACKDGIQLCVVPSTAGEFHDGHWGDCKGDVLPADELCDGIDNNCNGATDEGCTCTAGETRPCGTQWNTPPCHPGRQTCQADGKWGACEDALGPTGELCGDGIDNDSNGMIDEQCGCVPVPEVCGDSRDNDCDGVIDRRSSRSVEPRTIDLQAVGIAQDRLAHHAALRSCWMAVLAQVLDLRDVAFVVDLERLFEASLGVHNGNAIDVQKAYRAPEPRRIELQLVHADIASLLGLGVVGGVAALHSQRVGAVDPTESERARAFVHGHGRHAARIGHRGVPPGFPRVVIVVD